MKFPKIPAQAEYLMEFFEESLHSLGAICERSWHDRLEVLAEGDAAHLWQKDDDLFSGSLSFAMTLRQIRIMLTTKSFRVARFCFAWSKHSGAGISPIPGFASPRTSALRHHQTT